jgi:tetratricopeptide (TPR) repeat protein
LAIDSFNDAINALKSAEAIRQTTDAKRFLVNTYWSRGDVLSELGRFDEALEDAEAAIRLATTSGRRDAAILNKARILARQRQCSAAIEIVQDVLQRTEDADMYFLAAEIAAICIPTSAELIDLEPGREESINMAMDWLEQAHVRGYFEIDYRVTDFRENLLFSELRELPRFEALMSQISKEETKNSQSTKH